MLPYVLKRLIAMLPTLLGITFVTFMIVNLAPGDPVATQFGQGGGEGSTGGDGAGGKDRRGDAIKAKKKLLGMVREDPTVQVWPLAATAGPEGPAPWERQARLPALPAWAQALVALPGGDLVVGDAQGGVWRLGPEGEVRWQAAQAPGAEGAAAGAAAGAAGTAEGAAAGMGATAGGVRALAVDGDSVLVGDQAGRVLRLALEDGAERARGPVLGRAVRDLVVLADGTVASACEDGKVRLHDPARLAPQQVLDGHRGAVHALTVLADGALLSGGYDRTLRAWDPKTGALVAELGPLGQAINDLAPSPAGDRLAVAGDDRKVRVIPGARTSAGLDPAAALVLTGHHKAVSTVAWSGDGGRLVSGGEDESARLWDAQTGAVLAISPDIAGELRQVLVVGDRVYTAARSWRTVPVWRRYLSWLWRTARLDFDRSFVDDRPVIDKIAEALPVTLGLNVLALLIIYAVSIPIGVLSAVRRGSAFDQGSGLLLFLLYSLPNFWLATLLIMGLSSEKTWDLLPSVGLQSPNHQDLSYLAWLGDRLKHLVLPVTVMVYGGFASLSRYVRSSMLDTIQEDYIRTARAKGLPEYVVVVKHALRNSLMTVVTLVASLLPAMIGGSVIVEYIFSIEGMGRLGFDAILARDYPVIMAITTFSAVLTLLGILVSDLLYSVVDPRVRTE